MTDTNTEGSQTPVPGSAAGTNDAEDLGEHAYWNYPLRGVHESLNVFGRRPLFILKDAWDDKPRSPHSAHRKDYHQVLDYRTELLLDVYPRKDMEVQGCALVEWRVPAADKEIMGDFDEMTRPTPGLDEGATAQRKPHYMFEKAMMHVKIAGVSDPDEDEVLSLYSSDGEHESNHNSDDEEEKWTTVYYPLLSFPKNRSKQVRDKLREYADRPEDITGTGYPKQLLAESILEEMKRADNTPTVINCT